LGDLCGGSNAFSSEITSRIAHLAGITVPAIEDQPDINDCVIFLAKSYRFSEKSGIYQFAKAVNEADAEKAINILKDEKFRDIKWLPANDNSLRQVISQYAVKHYHEYAGLEVYDRLQISNTKKILCALRVSDWGAQKINHQVEKEIKRTIKQLDFKEWYDGRIVIATKNDSLLKLRNGEIGIFEEMDGERIRFEGDEPIKVSPARLTEYEPAYAITIHKSQGSEFDDVAIILPSIENSILSKEILYTSVTRARQNSLIITKEEILKKTILNSVSRSSGLKQKLWGSLK
jgi:exodeoxyribonuclease V alpha subunit